jgi:hypothetical protein
LLSYLILSSIALSKSLFFLRRGFFLAATYFLKTAH